MNVTVPDAPLVVLLNTELMALAAIGLLVGSVAGAAALAVVAF